ncbi:MAG: DUF58 domain-containing protein [Candidatus Omnitrophica bacterium CG11_big_fil_rev_8_21_14_0_20_45_26]|uniref:DUF58 domain-containing protein n=1 Tax=Candidatus Abzuiibacterium crystallinum TaxID=1974748 RepID=A0A2H0LS64_9BACT|nr:MAG: DUF58 domain-containing protein [Candidatus Omnitrophica bacterium CG11_big_fil_rev_8_21_14_0_20_45_26]PIW65011.1 MAG: DUF58 domain-containing protein [Candidatus Omnitrophica bacterium CG12_big_fil_rev_8_21_14_0_65_45_16]
MIPKDVLKQVKRIEIRTNRLVNDLFGGEYGSIFKGQGIEFADVREYVPGDDIRTIDWNVTARSDKTFVKKYVEERELTVLFVVDGSGSQHFGTASKFKSTIAAEICALLAFSAIRNNDKVGLLIFTDEIEKIVPIKKGRSHALRVIREILFYEPKRKKTNLKAALEHLQKSLRRNAIIFIVSDFMDDGYEKPLKVLGRKHDVIAIRLVDPREKKLPRSAMLELEDAETGEKVLVDTRSKQICDAYQRHFEERFLRLNRLFRSIGIDRVDIQTDGSYTEPLIKLFREREKRK